MACQPAWPARLPDCQPGPPGWLVIVIIVVMIVVFVIIVVVVIAMCYVYHVYLLVRVE